MQCMSCGHVNAGDAKFCSQCGTRLAVACAACGSPNEPGSRFCASCGTRLVGPEAAGPGAGGGDDLSRYVPDELLRRIRAAQAGGVMRGERRTVTMLFADIQGSTAAAERLDPEDWAEIMNGAFALLIAPVYRYEGTLARLQGDAVLAFFGAPTAHEDDPVRAVRAGLDMVAAVGDYQAEVEARTGVPIAVRVGVNTGLVVVGEVGSDLRVEYTALGDAINVAARMEQTAEPGTVRVTEHTATLLSGMFDLDDIGPVEVKGKAEPVRAFAVRGPAAVASGRPGPGPLVGRETEQAVLHGVVDRLRDGVGGICALVGEAGIGKSRLLSALRAHLRTRAVVVDGAAEAGGDIAWLQGHSRSFDTSVPYALFTDLLRRWWALDAGQPADAWGRVAASVSSAFGAADPDTAAFLATMVGVPVPPEAAALVAALETPVLHQKTTSAVVAYLEAEAAARPVLLVLDDLHWSDALSLALVEQLLASAETASIAVVLAMRPDRDEASWRLVERASRDHGHRTTLVELQALPDAATRELLERLLGAAAVDDEASGRILDRANGNPLFVEELVASLGEGREHDGTAVARIEVPASLSGLLTARLDQLAEPARLVAQVASVVGAEFSAPPVAALLDGAADLAATIPELLRRGIIVERRRQPDAVYAFRHALIHETAYSTTLLRTRRELHARLADYLEAAGDDVPHEIARHLVEAGARERAFPHLVEAGMRATRSMALSDAIELFTTALEAVPADADSQDVIRAHDGLGEAYGYIPDLSQASKVYQRLFDYGQTFGQPSFQVKALNQLGAMTATHTGDFPRAEQYLAEARQLAEDSGDDLGLAEYHMNACMIASFQGQLEQAIKHDEETARLGASQGSGAIRLAGLMRRALNLLATMQFAEAGPALAVAIEAAEDLGAVEELTVLRTAGGSDLALRDGELRRVVEIIAEAMPTLDRFGSFYAAPMRIRAAAAVLDLGDLEGALARAAEGRRHAEQNDQAFAAGTAAATMAHAYALCGAGDPQTELRDAALASMQGPMSDFLASSTWAHLGWASLALGAREQAAEDFAAGLGVSSAMRYWERPRLLIGAAFAALARGEPADARRILDDATVYVTERTMVGHDAELALGAGLVAAAEGRTDEAADALDRAERLAAAAGRRLVERDVAAARHRLATAVADPSATAHLEHARRITDDIAATIAAEELRGAFLARSALALEDRRPVTGP